MSDETSHDLIVIGTGVAGLSAAKLALQSGLRTATMEAQMFGGLVLNVNELDGAVSGSGSEFASSLMMEVSELGGEDLSAAAAQVVHDGQGLVVASDCGRHRARAIIVASGASLKKLGVPGEAEFEYKGVSHCADCDGPMLQGQDVVVAGGGDSALQSALVLAKYCRQVHLVHRGGTFRAQQHLCAAVAFASNIEVHWHCVVDAVLGSQGVDAVQVHSLQGGSSQTIACSGFFAFVGLQPACDFLPAAVARDERGFVVTADDHSTAMPGLYAAGAVRSGCGGSVADAIADGEAAARAAVNSIFAKAEPHASGLTLS